MKRVLLLSPGPLSPGDDAGLATSAALAAERFGARGHEVVVVSPHAVCPAARFAVRSYAESFDGPTLAAIAREESSDLACVAFGGEGALACSVAAGIAVLGIEEPRALLAPIALPPSSGVKLYVEVLRDLAGGTALLGAFEGPLDVPLSDAELHFVAARPEVDAALMRARALLAEAKGAGVFSFTFVVRGSDVQLRDVRAGARASTVAAARIAGVRLGEVAADLALDDALSVDDVLPRGVSALSTRAVRRPVLVHDRFGVARTEGVVAGVGQTLAVAPPETCKIQSSAIVVAGAGAYDLEHGGGADVWTADAVRALRERGTEVVVVDDDPGSLAGALADRWILAPPSEAARIASAEGLRAPSEPALPAFELRAARDPSNARKLGVVVLADGAKAILVATLEYVEPASVHVGDSAAFFPPQSVDESLVRAAEDAAIAAVLAGRARGAFTLTFHLEGGEALVAEATRGPSPVLPFVERATGVRIGEAAAKIALGDDLASLGLRDTETPAFVAARETAMPAGLLGASASPLGAVKRSLGDAIGVAETLATAYRKALCGVGFVLERPRDRDVVVLAPEADDVSDAVAGARKLYPLGFRLVAIGPVAGALRATRIPFEELEDADSVFDTHRVALAFVTGLGVGPSAARLRQRSLSARVPCFTSSLLFREACAVLEEDVAPRVRPLLKG